MLIGDISLEIPGLERDWEQFREVYGANINSLWTSNFNKEDIANKSDKHFNVMLYQYAFRLAKLVKQQYLYGANEITISTIDVGAIREKLRINNIDFDEILRAVHTPEPIFSLKVVDDEVQDTVGGREIDTDTSTTTTYTTSTQDNLDVFVPATTGVVHYNDNIDDLKLTKDNDINFSFKFIGIADDVTTPGDGTVWQYNYGQYQIQFRRVTQAMRMEFDDGYAKYSYSFYGNIAERSWIYLVANIKIKQTSLVNTTHAVSIFKNGLQPDVFYTRLAPLAFVSTYTPEINPRYVILNDDNQSNNLYHEISWYRGQFSEEDIMKDYLYYKNLITI